MNKLFPIVLALLCFSCEEDSPSESVVGCENGAEYSEFGYHCGDLQVLQDIMDANNVDGEPLDFTYLNYYGSEVSTQTWTDGRLTSFRYSGAYASPNLVVVPESIGDLTSLIGLTLRNNGISSIPESIGNLSNLTSLDIGINNLTSFPIGILSLNNLYYLDLYDNWHVFPTQQESQHSLEYVKTLNQNYNYVICNDFLSRLCIKKNNNVLETTNVKLIRHLSMRGLSRSGQSSAVTQVYNNCCNLISHDRNILDLDQTILE